MEKPVDKTLPIELKLDGREKYVCSITKEIDKYLHGVNDIYYSYLYDYGPREKHDRVEGYVYAIRSPGSTKGHIYLDKDDRIVEFEIHDYALHHFDPQVKELEKEFIGCKLTRKEQ